MDINFPPKKYVHENLKAKSPADINRSKRIGKCGILQLFG
jgi:hypothetical protein